MAKLEEAKSSQTFTEANTNDTKGDEVDLGAGATCFAEELQIIKSLPAPDPQELAKRSLFLGPTKHKNVLVLDLDETLVCSVELEEVEELGLEDNLAVRIRPYAQELLERLHTVYELVVFTAAEEVYAKRVVDLLDPSHKWISRVLARPSCISLSTGDLVKDLRILADRSLEHVLIVDNDIFSFAFQLPNGIPIMSFDGNNDDEELLYLIDYLESLSQESNPVKVNSARMGLQLELAK